jgi:hypothetical protein
MQSHASIRTTIENVSKSWRRLYPLEVDACLRIVDHIRQSLHRPNAVSEEKLTLLRSVKTNRLNGVMCHIFGQQWERDPVVSKIFYEVFAKLLVNEKSVPIIKNPVSVLDGAHFNDIQSEFAYQHFMESAK